MPQIETFSPVLEVFNVNGPFKGLPLDFLGTCPTIQQDSRSNVASNSSGYIILYERTFDLVGSQLCKELQTT